MSSLERIAATAAQRLEAHRLIVLVILTVVGAAASIVMAFGRPLWHDEIVTVLLARLPSLATIWRAQLDGADFFPPLNTFVTHAVHGTFGDGPVVSRLPAIVSVWATSVIVFEIVRRRSDAVAGVVAFTLPLLTTCFRYSYEARGYGLMLVLFAASLFAWSEAARGKQRPLHLAILALLLAASLWNHYFAVVTFVPIAIGEAVRLSVRRRPDWAMYAVFGVAGLLVLPLVPLARATAAAGPAAWHSTGFVAEVIDTCRFLMGFLLARRFLVVFAALLAGFLLQRLRHRPPPAARILLPAHEIAAGLTCLLMPAGAILLGTATGAYLPRYVLPFIVGLAIVVPLMAVRLAPNAAAQMLVCLIFVGSFVQLSVQAVAAAPLSRSAPLSYRPVLVDHLKDAKPIVLTGVVYLQMWYYAPPEWQQRLWYVADPNAARQAIGTATTDINLLALRKYAPLTVADYQSFVANERRFLVFSRWERHWLLQRLQRDGGHLSQVGQESGVPLYDVSFEPK